MKTASEVLNLFEAKYREIIFLQDSQDFNDFKGTGGKGLSGFFDSDEQEMFDYLYQYDSPDNDNIVNYKPWGTSDTTVTMKFSRKTFVMNYNERKGYAGLVEVL